MGRDETGEFDEVFLIVEFVLHYDDSLLLLVTEGQMKITANKGSRRDEGCRDRTELAL